jgi:hypothetical protein
MILSSITAPSGHATTFHLPPPPPMLTPSKPNLLSSLLAHSRKLFVELPENSLMTPSVQLVPSLSQNLQKEVYAVTWSRPLRVLQTSLLMQPQLWLKTWLKSLGWSGMLMKLHPGRLLLLLVQPDSQLQPTLLTLKLFHSIPPALLANKEIWSKDLMK